MIGAVVPEVPAIGLFAVGLLAALTALFLVFLRFAAITLVGSLMRWVASALSVIPFVGGWTAGVIDDAINSVDNALGVAVAASEKLAVQTLQDSLKLTRWVGATMAHLATETLHGFNVLVTHTIPHAVEDAVGHLRGRVETIETTIEHLDRSAIREVRSDIAGVRREAASAERRISEDFAAAEHAITTTLPHAIGHEVGELRGWTSKQLRRLTRRLSATEEALTLGALTAVVVGIVARHWKWIKCGNVAKVGKHLCGLPVSLLEQLLADAALDATALLITLNLREFVTAAQDVFGATEKEIATFWSAGLKSGATDRALGSAG